VLIFLHDDGTEHWPKHVAVTNKTINTDCLYFEIFVVTMVKSTNNFSTFLPIHQSSYSSYNDSQPSVGY
jgi:hypothetical protein